MNDRIRKEVLEGAIALEEATEEIECARYAIQFIGMALQGIINSTQYHSNPVELSKGAAQITSWIDESLQVATSKLNKFKR